MLTDAFNQINTTNSGIITHDQILNYEQKLKMSEKGKTNWEEKLEKITLRVNSGLKYLDFIAAAYDH